MMEHQDYADLPDDQFEKLSEKLHIKEKWRPMVSYLVSLGLTTKELEKCLVNCEEIFLATGGGLVLTRVEYLQNELGFEGARAAQAHARGEPAILLHADERHSIPRCRYLTELKHPVGEVALDAAQAARAENAHLRARAGESSPPRRLLQEGAAHPKTEIPKCSSATPWCSPSPWRTRSNPGWIS